MQRIDSHQHFWRFDPVKDSWITDEMAAIRKDFLPAQLQPLLEENSFDGCVAVQANQSDKENAFLLALAESNPFIKGIVGWVDLQADNIEEQLDYYRNFKKIKGFRHVLQSEEDRAFMLRPKFMKGISKLQPYNFTYDILIFPDQLQFIPEFVSAFPTQKFVIDHIAKPPVKEGKMELWEKGMHAVAAFPNVSCKISGMVTEADWGNWKVSDFTPYLNVVEEAFGINRLMYGSDWPVCLVAANYAQMLGIVEAYFSKFPLHEQGAFFGGNAAAFYDIEE